MDTTSSISTVLNSALCSAEVYNLFQKRLSAGLPTHDENPETHFIVYFFPYNPETKQVFLIHHKKSELWIAPGGHIDKNETALEALNREIAEELGVKDFFKNEPLPFLFTITPINNWGRKCTTHFDIWYLMKTDGHDFIPDKGEFYDSKWLTIEEAKKIVTNPQNLEALESLKK